MPDGPSCSSAPTRTASRRRGIFGTSRARGCRKAWRAEWGGLLLFKDDAGEVVEAFTPGFNVLNVFRVPQAHAVSMVTPFAGAPRLSITGWWRTQG